VLLTIDYERRSGATNCRAEGSRSYCRSERLAEKRQALRGIQNRKLLLRGGARAYCSFST
jgi:hypothetical protein